MPNAVDPSLLGNIQLPMDRNPLQRISYQPAKSVLDIDALIEQIRTFVEDYLFPVIEELTGIDLSAFLPLLNLLDLDFSNPAAFLTSLMDAIMALPAVLASMLTSLVEQLVNPANSGQLTELLTALITMIASLPELLIQLAESLISSGAGLLGVNSPLNALNIFGNLPSNLFGLIPASGIGGESPNLLSNAGFEGAISLSEGGGWTWDAVNGHTSPGCATTTADGNLKAIHSNTVYVTEGQELDLSVWVQTVSYAGTGTPLRMGVRTFLGGNSVGTTTIASRAAAPSWSELSGTYTVPAGVDAIRLRCIVDTTATGGTVRFDDGEMRRTGNGPFDGILDLFGLSSLDDLFGVDVEDIWSQIISLIINPLGLLDAEGVPIISDIMALFGGASNPTGVNNWLTDLLGLLGNPTDVGTGSPEPDPIGFVPIFGGLLQGLFGGFSGIFDQEAPTQEQVGEQAEGLSNSVQGTNSALLQIQAALSPGTPDSDDFEFSNGSSWGTNWRVMKSAGGTASVDGHNAVFAASYGADEEMIGLRLLKQASGNNQTVSIAQATASGAITDGNAAVDLWLRCTNFTTYATRTGLRMRFWANKALELHWFNNGTPTLIATGTSPVNYSSSSTLVFEAGQGLDPDHYVAKVNNTPALDWTDSTSRGLGNTYRGVGLRGEFSLLFLPPLEMQPAKLKQWTATG